jgi:nitroreductase
MKKILISVCLVMFFGILMLNGQTPGNPVTDAILKSYSPRAITATSVSNGDLDLILKCGMKAPSGMNAQPWKFTVVKDLQIAGEIVEDITAGNILIVISGQEKKDGTVDPFDCGLATENMYLAAQSLGLAARIYGSPVTGVNRNLKEKLGIPAGYKAVIILRIGGYEKGVDAVSSASVRKKPEEVINYK